jgi:hypothetical protein
MVRREVQIPGESAVEKSGGETVASGVWGRRESGAPRETGGSTITIWGWVTWRWEISVTLRFV